MNSVYEFVTEDFMRGAYIDLGGQMVAIPKIERIAYCLSRTMRFAGGGHRSVARHSILAAQIAKLLGYSVAVQYAALMHDAVESVFGDIPMVVKHQASVVEALKEIEDRYAGPLLRHFGVNHEDVYLVKGIDRGLGTIEYFEIETPVVSESLQDESWQDTMAAFLKLYWELRAEVEVLQSQS